MHVGRTFFRTERDGYLLLLPDFFVYWLIPSGLLPPDFFVYWLIPSGLLLRERPEVLLLPEAVPRLDELLPPRDEDDEEAVPRLDELLLRDDDELFFMPDLFSEACDERPEVLLFDSFMTLTL